MTAKQLVRWEQYAEVEPFDEARADYRAASIVQMLHNVAVRPQDRKPLGEFVLRFDERTEEASAPRGRQPVEEQLAFLKILAMTAGARSD